MNHVESVVSPQATPDHHPHHYHHHSHRRLHLDAAELPLLGDQAANNDDTQPSPQPAAAEEDPRNGVTMAVPSIVPPPTIISNDAEPTPFNRRSLVDKAEMNRLKRDGSERTRLLGGSLTSPATTLTNLSNSSFLVSNHLSVHNNGTLSSGHSAQSLPNKTPNEVMDNGDGLKRRPSLGTIESQKIPPQLPRLVAKNGECMVRPIRQQNHYLHMYRNWFHLLIEFSWRNVIAVFAAGFIVSWIFFGFMYYLIVYLSGDIQNRPEHKQCIANVHSLLSAFLFSVESQQTIGYGSRYMTEMCPPAYLILIIQLIVGLLLQTMLAGIVVAKVLRPKKRKQEMRFSRCAVIGPLDDDDQRPALMIRIADIQHSLYLAESHVRLYMARTRINSRGEKELLGFRDMNVGYDSGWDRVLLLWPIIIRHIIDEDSPLYGLTPDDMRRNDFELVMTVEGIVEATGATFQARTSFLPFEIQWGRRFTPLVHLNRKSGNYEVDYGMFDMTDRCDEYVPRVLIEIKNEIERHAEEEGEDHHFYNKSGFT